MKEELIKIYQDTKSVGLKFQQPITNKYTGNINVNYIEKYTGDISVENLDSVSAAIKYSKLGKTTILNMASYKRPGGGVENGARAQEECLFRCSNLFNINSNLYPLNKKDLIYSKDVTFFKDFNYQSMDPIVVDVVTSAAINLNGTDIPFDEWLEDTNYKINQIIDIALLNGTEYLVLGAWGCGVFKNDPFEMANLMWKNLVKRDKVTGHCKMRYFKKVVFAVINDHNSVSNNYEIFGNVFGI
jgi:uncharacterized protein (TIGR02452 family)